ncbi:MAG: hypothetical protein ABIW81_01915 [Terrimesophilobacter sp.]
MRKSRTTGALIAIAAILLLSGCVRFQAHLTVTPENTLNGDIVVASIVGDADNAKNDAKDRAVAIEKKLLPNLSGADGVTRSDYDSDGYAGSRFSLSNTPLEAINSNSDNGSLSLKRDGDTFMFDGTVNFTPNSDQAPPKNADKSNIEVAITFPGTVTKHNGKLEGTRVSWNTSYEGSLDMHAVASAEPVGPPAWVWVLVGAGILVTIAIMVIVVVATKRRRTATTT